MDREFVLALLLAGAAAILANALASRPVASQPPDEASALRRLAAPISFALVLFAAPMGFAIVEPDTVGAREAVPVAALVLAGLALLVVARALVRAFVHAWAVPSTRTAATLGLVRPRVVIADCFARVLDHHERAAVEAHEEAHRRRRDPLRIWLGRLIADLQWPLRGPEERLSGWLHALELARDDEARARGIDGADLASAILKAARFERAPGTATAGLADDSARLSERIERLLEPRTPARPAVWGWFLGALASALATALLVGAVFGDVLFVEVLGWHS